MNKCLPQSLIGQFYLRKIDKDRFKFISILQRKIIFRFVFFLGLSLAGFQTMAQRDQITTQAGVKIRCKILDETPTRFIYAYLSPAGKVLKSEIFKNLVSDFKYDFFPSDINTKGGKVLDEKDSGKDKNNAVPTRVDTRKKTSSKNTKKPKEDKVVKANAKETEAKPDNDKIEVDVEEKKPNIVVESAETKPQEILPETVEKVEQKVPQETQEATKQKKIKEAKEETPLSPKTASNEYSNHLKWRVGVRGGFGNMLAKIPTSDDFSIYQEKLLRGFTLGADASYFVSDHFGIGVMYHDFRSRNSAKYITYYDQILNKEATGSINNKRSTKFIGRVFYYRKNIDFKTMVVLGVFAGAYYYSDKGVYGDVSYTFKGMDYGASVTLGIDFLLGNDITGRDVILSLETGYSYGKINKLDRGTGATTLGTPLDLSRVDFTIGLRFLRFPKYLRLTSY